jgi:hypothetical protein
VCIGYGAAMNRKKSYLIILSLFVGSLTAKVPNTCGMKITRGEHITPVKLKKAQQIVSENCDMGIPGDGIQITVLENSYFSNRINGSIRLLETFANWRCLMNTLKTLSITYTKMFYLI